jgi:hypothetical protein
MHGHRENKQNKQEHDMNGYFTSFIGKHNATSKQIFGEMSKKRQF